MPTWIYNGFLLWLALMGASFTLPILRWTVAPGRWSFVRHLGKLCTTPLVILNGVRDVKNPGIFRCAQNDRVGLVQSFLSRRRRTDHGVGIPDSRRGDAVRFHEVKVG